jgi:hypothetical protein
MASDIARIYAERFLLIGIPELGAWKFETLQRGGAPPGRNIVKQDEFSERFPRFIGCCTVFSL